MLRGPYQQQNGGVLGTLQSVKDTYEKDLKERTGSWAWNCLANFQLQVACDVSFFVGRKQQQRKTKTQIDQKLGAILDLKISLESLSSFQGFFLRGFLCHPLGFTYESLGFISFGIPHSIHRHSWHRCGGASGRRR